MVLYLFFYQAHGADHGFIVVYKCQLAVYQLFDRRLVMLGGNTFQSGQTPAAKVWGTCSV